MGRFEGKVAVVDGMALRRMGRPGDAAGSCSFLLCDEAGRIMGQIFDVDGGQVFRS
jgi:3-oxoacyl-[acyl-carrier protein] reductase